MALRTPSYTHTQKGTALVAFLLVACAIIMVSSFFTPAPASYTVFVAAALILVTTWLMSSLTIEVGEGRLAWSFGPGLIRKSVALAEIVGAETISPSLLWGVGIHYTTNGWLYNVAVSDAVRITLRSGKRFVLGTDDANGLIEAINKR